MKSPLQESKQFAGIAYSCGNDQNLKNKHISPPILTSLFHDGELSDIVHEA